jgi:putative transposase
MRCIDKLHLDHPFAGARMLRDLLRTEGHELWRKHFGTLMRKMGSEALYRRQNKSKRHAAHRVYPYLLRNLPIERPDQVWAMDITYLPMKRGFVYLTVLLDWARRRILSWRLSNTLTSDVCVEALEEAVIRHGCPEIMNSDQGSQFTRPEVIATLQTNGIAISMDGKGCWRDNVFVERLWRTITTSRGSTCAPTKASATPRRISRATSPCTRAAGRTAALTGASPINVYFAGPPTCSSRLNPAGTSLVAHRELSNWAEPNSNAWSKQASPRRWLSWHACASC